MMAATETHMALTAAKALMIVNNITTIMVTTPTITLTPTRMSTVMVAGMHPLLNCLALLTWATPSLQPQHLPTMRAPWRNGSIPRLDCRASDTVV